MDSASGALVKRVCLSLVHVRRVPIAQGPTSLRLARQQRLPRLCRFFHLFALGAERCAGVRIRSQSRAGNRTQSPPATTRSGFTSSASMPTCLGGGEALSAIVDRIDMAVKFRKVKQATSVVSVVGHMSSSDDMEPHLEVGMRVLVCAPLRLGWRFAQHCTYTVSSKLSSM